MSPRLSPPPPWGAHDPRGDADLEPEPPPTPDELARLLPLLEAEIAQCLWHVCEAFPPEEFARLVSDIALLSMEYGLAPALLRELRARSRARRGGRDG